MMFLFAFISLKLSLKDWPIALIHATEVVLGAAAVASLLLAPAVRRMRASARQEIVRNVVAVIGGISASIALIMPFELAPFFFGAKGETMLATILLIPLYPVAALLFCKLFRGMTMPTRPPALPSG